MIKVDRIKLPVTHDEASLKKKLEGILQLNRYCKGSNTPRYSYRIIRRSLDARRKPELFYVFSVTVTLDKLLEEKILKHSRSSFISRYEPVEYSIPEPLGDIELKGRPVIAGSGPAGLFCAYLLCRRGYAPLVIERGEDVDKRTAAVREFWNTGILKHNSNVQFGEGGAGTFSDGKLNTGVNDKKGRNRFVLDTFVDFGAPEETAYDAKPHLGTDMLVNIVRSMREYIIKHGGSFEFETLMTDIETDENEITAVIVRRTGSDNYCDKLNNSTETFKDTGDIFRIETNCLVLAIGHSARDTFYMLKAKGINMVRKNFAVGLRIQHPQEMIDDCQYGKDHDSNLPPADYKLTNHTNNGRDVYSFCMCPGGYVVNASSEEGRLAVNGMSYSGRDSLVANSAIIVSVGDEDFGSDDVLAGMEFQRRLEERAYDLGEGCVPVQKYGDYKNNTVSTGAGDMVPRIKGAYKLANLRDLLPEDINNAIIETVDKFGYTMEGFDRPDAILAGVESRTSSPVRILRDDEFMGSIAGLYPCGEGAGYAGGITSAAMDGIKVAEMIMSRYSQPASVKEKI